MVGTSGPVSDRRSSRSPRSSTQEAHRPVQRTDGLRHNEGRVGGQGEGVMWVDQRATTTVQWLSWITLCVTLPRSRPDRSEKEALAGFPPGLLTTEGPVLQAVAGTPRTIGAVSRRRAAPRPDN